MSFLLYMSNSYKILFNKPGVLDASLWQFPATPYYAVGLFTGCGGLELGFRAAGFRFVVSSDFDADACTTFRQNSDSPIVEGDITSDEVKDRILELARTHKIDIIIGGPPCQGFSSSGKLMPDDPRNKMFLQFVAIAKNIKPKMVVVENVKGIVKGRNKAADEVIKAFREIGYKMEMRVLKASDYGVAQHRERAIFIGTRADVPIMFPEPTHSKDNYVTVADAIGDLLHQPNSPEKSHEPAQHQPSTVEKMKRLKEGESMYGSRKDSARKLIWSEPSFTIKDNHGNAAIHPVANRTLTARELARIQSFPDSFDFSQVPKKSQFRQIGNAVPPLMAYHIAMAVRRSLALINE